MRRRTNATLPICVIIQVLALSCGLCKKQQDVDPDVAELRSQVEKLQMQVKDMKIQLDDLRLRLDAAEAKESLPAMPLQWGKSSGSLEARCEEKNGKYFVTGKEVAELKENQAGVMTSLRVVPYYAEGVITGMKLYGIRSDSFPGSCGLQNGDVVSEVNGLKLTSPENMLGIHEQIAKDGKAVIKIDRKGTSVEIVIGTE